MLHASDETPVCLLTGFRFLQRMEVYLKLSSIRLQSFEERSKQSMNLTQGTLGFNGML
jgi:hypothetical protein